MAGERRANPHVGGTGVAYELDDHERRVAESAARACGLEVVGVDILTSSAGPLVLELNPNPGILIEEVTGVDVVGAVVARLAEMVASRQS